MAATARDSGILAPFRPRGVLEASESTALVGLSGYSRGGRHCRLAYFGYFGCSGVPGPVAAGLVRKNGDFERGW